ncbi:hypothetical protein U9M48_001649 [Paspalum notatum var. saurae]|uniref:Uncharacterized protein n=1 Tax=Paspalum notatum var. saurae TaxID=547442 RepID=A0AAQ3PJS5_PASNO
MVGTPGETSVQGESSHQEGCAGCRLRGLSFRRGDNAAHPISLRLRQAAVVADCAPLCTSAVPGDTASIPACSALQHIRFAMLLGLVEEKEQTHL